MTNRDFDSLRIAYSRATAMRLINPFSLLVLFVAWSSALFGGSISSRMDEDHDWDTVGVSTMEIVRTTREPHTKWLAIRTLAAIRYDPAVPLLLESLSDPSPLVRANAARALGEMRVRAASQPLIQLLKREKDGGVVEQTSAALNKLRAKEAVPVLKAVVNQPNEQTRTWILLAISELGNQGDVPFFAKYLEDPSIDMRYYAAKSIARLVNADFGFVRNGIVDQSGPIERAKSWWKEHEREFSKQ